ncbi:MAG: hypothetical protein JRF33_06490 [Deltaproteobacteria bacterium]|nr:hypothetical protein [Deltaproteobacteria bacterium]
MKHRAIQSLWQFADQLVDKGHDELAQQLKPKLGALDECWRELEEKGKQRLDSLVHVAQMAEVGAQMAGLMADMTKAMGEIQDFVAQARGHFETQEQAELVTRSTLVARKMEELRQAHFLVQRLLGDGMVREMEASIEAVVVEMFSVYQFQLDSRNIQIEVDLPPNLPRLRMERQKLFHVLAHLVGNAIDAVADANERCILIQAHDLEDQSVCIQVADTGGGIPATFRNRIFEPNFSTKGNRGTGLGLHIATQLVEATGGTLRLGDHQSMDGTHHYATMFELLLPAVDVQPSPAPPLGMNGQAEMLEPLEGLEDFDDEGVTFSEAKALNAELQDFATDLDLGADLPDAEHDPAEDKPEHILALAPALNPARVVERYLKDRSIQLEELHSIDELKARMVGPEVDLVLLDSSEKDVDVMEFAHFLKAEHPGVPLLLAVSSDASQTTLGVFELGGYDHLVRPVPSGVLVAQKIRADLNHRGTTLRGVFERRNLLASCREQLTSLPEEPQKEAENKILQILNDFVASAPKNKESQILILGPSSMARMTTDLQGISCLSVDKVDDAIQTLMSNPEIGVVVAVDGTGGSKGMELLASLYSARNDLAVLLFTRERDIQDLYEAMGDRIGDIVLRPGEGRQFFEPRLRRLITRQGQSARHLDMVAKLNALADGWREAN